MMNAQTFKTLFSRLKKRYPSKPLGLTFSNPLELLIATMLSAQCTDKRVNEVTKTLFVKYRTVEAYARARILSLEKDVRSTGFYRNKAKNVKATAQMLIDDFHGEVPQTMDELLCLPGVARKTANIVLGKAFGQRVGIAVDTHVLRISRLLGLTESSDPKKTERVLMTLVPQKEWTAITDLFIAHGREVCVARRPKCALCCISAFCPSCKL